MKTNSNLQLWMFIFLAYIYSNSVLTIKLSSQTHNDDSETKELEIKDYLDLYLQSLKDSYKYKNIRLPTQEIYVKKFFIDKFEDSYKKALADLEDNLKKWKINVETIMSELSEEQVGASSKSNISTLKINSLKEEINQINEMLEGKTNGLSKKIDDIFGFVKIQKQDSSIDGLKSILSSLKSFSNISDIINSSLTQLVKSNYESENLKENVDVTEINSVLANSIKSLQHTIKSGNKLSKVFKKSLTDLKLRTDELISKLDSQKKELAKKKEANQKKKDQIHKLKESKSKLIDLEQSYIKQIKTQISKSESLNIKKELINQSISERNNNHFKSQLEIESTIKNLKNQVSIVKSSLNPSSSYENKISNSKSSISKLLQYEDMILNSKINH